MERTLSIPIGVLVARAAAVDDLWAAPQWRTVGIVVGPSSLSPGSLMHGEGEDACFFADTAMLELYASDLESYRINMGQEVPGVYLVLKPRGGHAEIPPSVHLVTAAPDEAESYCEGDDWLVGTVPMPRSLCDVLVAFMAAHESEGTPSARSSTTLANGAPYVEGNSR